MRTSNEEWQRLLRKVREISGAFESVILIGGVAVFLHALKRDEREYLESSHDGDFAISLADYADLRDIFEVTSNRRLSKHQMIEGGLEFDVYVESVDRLPVPFSDLSANSDTCSLEGVPVRMAGLEHLLILKVVAYSDRKASAKGEKDARDILKILYLSEDGMKPELLFGYINQDPMSDVDDIVSRFPLYLDVAKGNNYAASKLKENVTAKWSSVKKALAAYADHLVTNRPDLS